MAQTYTDLLYHVVFSTKDRLPCLRPEIREGLGAYINGILRNLEGNLVLCNGTEDHLHLLVVLRPTSAVADAVRTIKANSSKWIHETWPEQRAFAWQAGYAAFSVSEPHRRTVRAYIARQEEHHRKGDFQQEYIELLRRHGISYEPGHLWG